jgi:DNA-binding response OmpR family regulator
MERKKILLVDDAKTVLMMEQMVLNLPEFELLLASSGTEAIELALAECPDLILLDVILPDVEGTEVCRRLRAEPQTESVPIIMVTTRSELHYIERAREYGCTDYVTKPFDPAKLLQTVRSHLKPSDV